MRKNKKGEWIATEPSDLLGWEIVDITHVERFLLPGFFLLEVKSKGPSKERRNVIASEEAVPLTVFQFGQDKG